ncbi:hypothetical protein EES43_15470 [Streptomyces sp. ADI96-02]|uniref:hypothetical protein n=1 Tax=Streptomyces sp. ADI96-02 TaxID=1522760 RepID=UPI000F559170|nr:hypothetical protein [Streptomyces sp. ADI96-02]RPK61470.1 hypothetical protein EES43_15470 [Streptomyces sp. ADI96-02]
MSSSEQQYPHPHDPQYPHPYDAQGRPYDPDRTHQPSGDQQSYGYQQAGQGQQPPYGVPSPSYGEQPYGEQPAGRTDEAPYWPDGTAARPTGQEPGAFDQGVTQTWQAPTWDTQYQPTLRPDQEPYGGHGRPQGPLPAQGPAQDQAWNQAQDQAWNQPTPQPPAHGGYQGAHRPPEQQTASPYGAGPGFPPQGATGSVPLPPEAPGAPAPAAAPVHAPAAAHAPAPDGSGYGAPTTLGGTRMTAAQRARAEGRSPIIAPGPQPAALTAVLGLLLAAGAAIGSYALLVPLVLLQAVTAAGWFRLNGMWPARQGIALAFAGGIVADVALLAAGREHGPAALLGTLGVWVLLTVVLQLRSHAGSDERMYGLTATVVSAALAVLAAGHLAAVPDAVVAGGAAVAVAVLARALPLPGAVSVAFALLAGAGAGFVAGRFTDLGSGSALLGLAAAGCALVGLRAASYDYPSRFVHMTAGVALPLTAAAPAVYLIGRVLV